MRPREVRYPAHSFLATTYRSSSGSPPDLYRTGPQPLVREPAIRPNSRLANGARSSRVPCSRAMLATGDEPHSSGSPSLRQLHTSRRPRSPLTERPPGHESAGPEAARSSKASLAPARLGYPRRRVAPASCSSHSSYVGPKKGVTLGYLVKERTPYSRLSPTCREHSFRCRPLALDASPASPIPCHNCTASKKWTTVDRQAVEGIAREWLYALADA